MHFKRMVCLSGTNGLTAAYLFYLPFFSQWEKNEISHTTRSTGTSSSNNPTQ